MLRFATAGQCGGKDVEAFEDLDLGFLIVAGAFEQCRQRTHVVGAEDDVDPGGLLHDRVPVLLCHASADGDLQTRVVLLDLRELAEVAVETVVGVLAHGAGVEDDDIGLVVTVGLNIAGIVEQSGQTLGVVHVHLTSVGLDLVAARRGLGRRRGVNQFSHRGTILAVPAAGAAPADRVTDQAS